VVDLEAASSDSWSDASVGSRVFEPQRVDDVRVAMGTQVRLAAYTTQSLGRGQIKKAFDAAYEELDRLEQLLSGWRDDSDVGRINQGAGEWIPVAKETAFVVSSSLQTSRLSHGVFDISFNVFADVWRFGDRKEKVPVLPTPAAVQEALKHVDYRRVGVHDDPPRVRIEKGMQISLGGIAKGYIVDQLRRELQRRGLTSFLVQAGGDLLGVGKKPDGTAWRSGVRDPRGGPDDWFAVIDLTDHAFSTAGDYARAFIVDGRRYHHIIDPRTGYPAEASRSVTIWARDALTADAIDDAVFILGPGEGLKLVESLPGVGALIVDKDNKVWVSRRLQGRVELVSQPSPGI
jgi:thiamine biosynthesis lipoprotein